MTLTLNAGYVVPAGYARTRVSFEQAPCTRHTRYVPGCPGCDYVEVRHRHELSGDTLALVLDREDGSVLETIGDGSGVAFAGNVATWGLLVVREDAWADPCPEISAALHAAELDADCFARSLVDLFPSE